MPYYSEKPKIENPFISKIITPYLVSEIIKKGTPGYKNDPLEKFNFFGYACAKEDRHYQSSLNSNQFYRANHIRLYFSWPDIEADLFKDIYIVMLGNKLDLKFWDRNHENGRNQFEHYVPLTDLKLIKQIEDCFVKIVTYWGMNTEDNEQLPALSNSNIEYNDVYELLNLIIRNPSKKTDFLAKEIVKANNHPELFSKSKENLHWDILSENEILNEEVVVLDWKSDFEDIIWAIKKSSKEKIVLKSDSFKPNALADENLIIAEELIRTEFSDYTLMYLDFPADSYFIFITKKDISSKIITLGKRCRIPRSTGL